MLNKVEVMLPCTVKILKNVYRYFRLEFGMGKTVFRVWYKYRVYLVFRGNFGII